MKKMFCAAVSLVVAVCFVGTMSAAGKAPSKQASKAAVEQPAAETTGAVAASSNFKPFIVYSDGESPKNHFFPSGWMGDFSDIRINSGWTDQPHSGKSCLKVAYSAKGVQGAGWAGMYWQQPMGNWGDRRGGYNLTGATRLNFWARGEKGGEKITEIKIGGITGEFPDTDSASVGPIELTTQWQKFTIDLAGKDLSNIIGGFCWTAARDDNPNGMTFYLDDIVYE